VSFVVELPPLSILILSASSNTTVMIMSDVTIHPEALIAAVVVQMMPWSEVGSEPITIAIKSRSITWAPMPASSLCNVIIVVK